MTVLHLYVSVKEIGVGIFIPMLPYTNKNILDVHKTDEF